MIHHSAPDPLDPINDLATEFLDRRQRGEVVSIEEYVQRHPTLAVEIRELFTSIEMMEDFKERTPKVERFGDVAIARLGDYRLIRELGRGGMGIVYEAEQESLGRRVAVKLLPNEAWITQRRRERFRREAQTAAQLHHTNIVPVLGVGEYDGYAYYVMQLINGVGLDRVIRFYSETCAAEDQSIAPDNASNEPHRAPNEPHRAPNEPVAAIADALVAGRFADLRNLGVGAQVVATSNIQQPSDAPSKHSKGVGRPYWKSVAAIGLQVAEALHYAHGLGTLHRDIKPANLLIDKRGVVWVADFGLAKVAEQESLSASNDVVGTLCYMAPEQFSGEADPRTDLYGLGATLYELVTQRPTFAERRRSVLNRSTWLPPTPPRKINPRIPRDLETIVMKALAPVADERYRSAGELALDLRRFLRDLPIQSRRPSAKDEAWRWCRRNPGLAASLATTVTVLALLVVVTTFGLIRMNQANRETAQALAAEMVHRRQAESVSNVASRALDEIFQQFTPGRSLATDASLDNAGLAVTSDGVRPSSEPVLSRQTAALLEKLLTFYNEFAAIGKGQRTLLPKLIDARRRVGDIYYHLGQHQQAIDSYKAAIALIHSAASEDSWQRDLKQARLYSALGVAHLGTHQLQASDEAFAAALRLLDMPDALLEVAPPEVAFELARTLYLQNRRDPLAPRHHRHRNHRRRTANEDHVALVGGNVPAGSLVGDAVLVAGDATTDVVAGMRGSLPPGAHSPRPSPPTHLRHRDDRQAARLREQGVERAVRILDQLVTPAGGIPAEHRFLMACCLRDLSTHGFDRQRSTSFHQQAIANLRELTRASPQAPEYTFELAMTLGIPNADIALPQQRASLAEAIDLMQNLVASHPQIPAYQHSFVKLALHLGHLHRIMNDEHGALRIFRLANKVATDLQRQYPESEQIQGMLWLAQHAWAGELYQQGRLSLAQNVLKKATGVAEAAVKPNPKARPHPPIVGELYAMLARTSFEMADYELALHAWSFSESFDYPRAHLGRRQDRHSAGQGGRSDRNGRRQRDDCRRPGKDRQR